MFSTWFTSGSYHLQSCVMTLPLCHAPASTKRRRPGVRCATLVVHFWHLRPENTRLSKMAFAEHAYMYSSMFFLKTHIIMILLLVFPDIFIVCIKIKVLLILCASKWNLYLWEYWFFLCFGESVKKKKLVELLNSELNWNVILIILLIMGKIWFTTWRAVLKLRRQMRNKPLWSSMGFCLKLCKTPTVFFYLKPNKYFWHLNLNLNRQVIKMFNKPVRNCRVNVTARQKSL